MAKFLLCFFAEPFIVAWWLMLFIGILHAHVMDSISPIGYSSSLGLAFCICLAVGSIQFWTKLSRVDNWWEILD